jgi:hypothetical protein
LEDVMAAAVLTHRYIKCHPCWWIHSDGYCMYSK